jgi:uncharacterized protein YbaA (DUF1428 family)
VESKTSRDVLDEKKTTSHPRLSKRKASTIFQGNIFGSFEIQGRVRSFNTSTVDTGSE